MEKSAENLRLNEDYYHAGTSTMGDLLDAQTRNQQSRDQYAEAVCLYLNSRTAYLIVTGREIEDFSQFSTISYLPRCLPTPLLHHGQ
jgi:outer membrane protein TolC